MKFLKMNRKFFLLVLMSLYSPYFLTGMTNTSDDLESGNYFTAINTQIAVITGDSIAQFIQRNQLTPPIQTDNVSLDTLIKNLKLESLNTLSGAEQKQILHGYNEMLRLNIAEHFHIKNINLSDPTAFNQILGIIGEVVGQYFSQDERAHGFSFVILLRNQNELWVCEIPSTSEVEAVTNGQKTFRAIQNGQSPFSGKEQEVLAAMEMFEPLLNKLFIEGKPQAMQERRKAMWSCCKGLAVVVAILIVAYLAVVGASSNLVIAVTDARNCTQH